ncbi:MAG: AI-2E family transporter [Erysipelotrichaceae bacterium]
MTNKLLKVLSFLKSIIIPLSSILLIIIIFKQIGIYAKLEQVLIALLPLALGFLIACLLEPIIAKLKLKYSKVISIVIVYFGILLIITILCIILIPMFIEQFIALSEAYPKIIEKIQSFLTSNNIPMNINTREIITNSYPYVLDIASMLFNKLTIIGIAFMASFFYSLEFDYYYRLLIRRLKEPNKFINFYQTVSNVIYQYLKGTILDLSFIAVVVSIYLLVMGFPNAILYGVVLAILNLFPYIGSILGLVIILLVAVISYDNIPIILFLGVWGIQQFEANVMQPLIFNKTMNIRPILLFGSLFLFEALFGIIGVILSPVLAAIIQIVFRSIIHANKSNDVGKWEDIWYDFDDVMRENNYE